MENESLITQLAKANEDKERLAELVKEYKKIIAANCAQSDELIEMQDKTTQTLQDCGITL
jgi:translation initiation factor 1 (eIF-1/SUI1)